MTAWLRRRRTLLIAMVLAVAFPFVVSLIDGNGFGGVLTNEKGNALFLQGLVIEIIILALYAISYDLILGITGLLSFGHAMFFAVGAYTFGIVIKSFGFGLVGAIVAVVIAAILQALLFAIIVPRVKGIAYGLVTLGISSMFWIVIQSTDLQRYAGAEIGLQGVKAPVWWLDTTAHRFVFYLVAVVTLLIVYLLYTRLVDAPLGRVLVAVRENEERAEMLGYRTFWFKLVALVVGSLTAAFAGVLHALHQSIITPNIAGLGFTVTALLIILIGGIGTLSGAIIGAAIYKLLQYYLNKWFGGISDLLIGVAYIAVVLYLPYGIVGTWRAKALDIKRGRQRLLALVRPNRDTS
jgi:branched-chain amino acid transport system permease protein